MGTATVSMPASGMENENTLISANNYASFLIFLKRFEEAKALMRKTIPVARRVLNEGNDLKLMMRWNYAKALYRFCPRWWERTETPRRSVARRIDGGEGGIDP